MATEDLIQQALTEAKKGNKEGSKKILSQIVNQEPKNVRAWYLLSQVIDDKEQKIFCLQKILIIQPENQQIKELLAQLKPPISPFEDIQLYPAKNKTTVETPKKKTQWWVYVLLIICVPILACMCLGMISAMTSDLKANLSNPSPGYYEIRGKMETMTEMQWKEYLDANVIGKSAVSWTGWIEEVQPGSAGSSDIWVDMDSPSELFSVQDVSFYLPTDQARTLQKDQKITFSGRITSVQNILQSCQVDLEAVEIK